MPGMTTCPNSYRGFRFPAEVIELHRRALRQCVSGVFPSPPLIGSNYRAVQAPRRVVARCETGATDGLAGRLRYLCRDATRPDCTQYFDDGELAARRDMAGLTGARLSKRKAARKRLGVHRQSA